MTMQVVNRKGEREDVRFDAIHEKLSSLTNGLDTNWVDAANLTKLTIEGLYDGVTTRELDQLAAETAASLASNICLRSGRCIRLTRCAGIAGTSL